MSSLDRARETQLNNIQKKTGRSLAEVRELIQNSGLTKHGEIRSMLMQELGLGYGDANSLVHFAQESDGQSAADASGATTNDVVDEIYSGPKAALRPIHDRLMEEINKLGSFEIAPKKGYLSLRRKKQFATIGPGTKSRVDVGLNMKGLEATPRLLMELPGSMCQYKVKITDVFEVDDELVAWLRTAYDSSG
ncbi:MAG: DUF4287 domain-containing protein [Chloroflexi bacterium]|nr:MAG: DUF4287 domain-containing protein [Chloroflexota bacterium]